MSPHIVLVSYNWPPRNAIGTHRPYSWAKYWSEAGVKVTVLTARKKSFDQPLDLVMPVLANVDVIEVDFEVPVSARIVGIRARSGEKWLVQLKRTKRALESWLGIVLDARDRWIDAATPKALQLAETADAVVSTFGPRACHLIAAKMKRYNPKLLWVADYRDLWSQSHLSGHAVRARSREAALELEEVGRHADLVTAVSEEQAVQLRHFLGKPAYVVYNGFEEDDASLAPEPAASRTADITKRIVYTGLLYEGSRDPSPLFIAIQELRLEGRLQVSDLQIDFYGPPSEWLLSLIVRYGLEDMVKQHGRVSRPTALAKQVGAERLLLLESSSAEAKGVLTGKLFEYLAARRPILSFGSGQDSAIAKLLQECGCGICVGANVAMAKILIEETIAGGTPEWYRPNQLHISRYSRKRQAIDLLNLIMAHIGAAQPIDRRSA